MIYCLAVRDPKTGKLRVLCPVEPKDAEDIARRHLEKFAKPKTKSEET